MHRLQFFNHATFAVWTALEATPDVIRFCKRPTRTGKDKSDPIVDLWVSRASTKNFYILDAQRRFIADSFDFVIQTIGVFDNQFLIKTGLRILSEKFAGLLQNIESSAGDSDESNTVFIIQSETAMEHCFDIILENEDYTVGKVLEYILYDKYYLGDKTLDFCGFKKFHPHDTRSTIRITFASTTDKSAVDKSVAKQYLIVACDKAKYIFDRMMKLF